jgi:hypothetical protein
MDFYLKSSGVFSLFSSEKIVHKDLYIGAQCREKVTIKTRVKTKSGILISTIFLK